MHCDCYHVIEEKPGKFRGECWGTKERDQVNCSGYTELCSNGLRKSETEPLFTAEMVIEAGKTNKTYKSGDMLFNTTKGFFSASNGKPWPVFAFSSLQEIFDLQWTESGGQVMTKAEAESKFNIKIVG